VFAPDGSAYNMTGWTSSIFAEYSGHPFDPRDVVDGDIDTWGVSKGAGAWLEVDMLETRKFGSFDLFNRDQSSVH
jgi:hypothetical protein